MTDIVMPQLGESVTEGTIVAWRKRVGDAVEADEFLCDVATDKVTFEVPSPASGVLAAIIAQDGETIAVGRTIARLNNGAGDGAAPAPAELDRSPVLPEHRADDARGEGGAPPNRPRPSPLARRLAREAGIDLSEIQGSGRRGRVRRDDVLAAISGQDGGPLPAMQADAPATSPHGAPPADRVVAFTPMRRAIADAMVRSVHSAPQGYIAFDVDYAGVERARLDARAAFEAKEGFKLTYLPFVLHALVRALRSHPLVNASVAADRLTVHRRIDLGIAVDLAHRGLMVPVIRDADALSLRGLARAVASLAQRARAGQLTAEHLAGATFTVTNPGPLGTRVSVPIINPPQAAILVTDGVVKRPAAVSLPDGTDVLAIRPQGSIGLTMDHRAFDGAYAAAFLKTLKVDIETVDWRQELSGPSAS